MTTAKTLPESFEVMSEVFPLRPIRDDGDLDRAHQLADRLAVLDRRTKGQEEYLQTLSLLIESYEDAHHQIETSDLDPVETLKLLLEQHGMNASDLGRLLGQRQLGAKILSRERQLSKSHMARLSARFGVSPAVFLAPEV